jgi:membrane protein YqaA with SNARE-associated domain
MGLKDYLRNDSSQSAMRLMGFLCVLAACIFSVEAGAAMILCVILARDGAIVGALLAGAAGVIGALLIPAFGGKAIQSFAESGETAPLPGVGRGAPMETNDKN